MLTLFENTTRLASGTVAQIAATAQAAATRGGTVLVIDDETGRTVDLDLRGTPEEIAARHAPKRGRPKLGVKAREVTLLPRHWDWLGQQRGGASAALRRLVEEHMRAEAPDPQKAAQSATYAATTTLAGDLPGYEEAMRALFKGDMAGFEAHCANWPKDIGAYLVSLTKATSRERG